MTDELKILMLEDDPVDAELATRALNKAGIAFSSMRVDTRDAFVAALVEFRPDIILADYHLPTFDGMAALVIAVEQTPDVPFIFVSGAMGEEFAIETLHQGAADYVIKDRLGKLAPAVSRALQEARERRLRHRAEAELAASEERFRKVAASAQDGLIIVDQDGLITYWNPAAEKIFGYTSGETLGQPLHELLAPARYHDAFRAGWGHFRATGQGAVIGHTLEMSALHKDGEEFPVELSISSVTINGRWHATGILRDISERRRAEAVRRELAAIVESSEDAIIGAAIDGRITSWNNGAAKIYGYSATETIGQSAKMLVPEERQHEIDDLIDILGSGRSVAQHETSRRRKDGRLIDVSVSLSPIRDTSGTISGISTIARDITELKAAERALQRSNRFLRTLSRCNETLVHATDEFGLLDDMCRVVVEAGGFPMAWVGYVVNDPGQTIRPMAQFGERAAEYVATLNKTWADSERGQGPTGRAVRTGQVQMAKDIATDATYAPWRARALEFGYRSSVALPLATDKGVIGTLNIYAAEIDVFAEEEIALLAELAADLAFGIVTVRTRAKQLESARTLAKALENTIQAIATTIETRDPYTAGHQQRVSRLAAAIAREMGLDEARVTGVQRGAEIHDIGKIYVPAEILNRPGKLSDIEFSMIKTHPQVGYDIIKEIDFPWPIAEMILQHHERLDGSGYPHGLTGNAISLEAKIIAVADVVEAMMNHRPYRAALGLDSALEAIDRGSGRLFDAAAVAACTRLLGSGDFVV
ncbi:MAG: PAS domain S-box protein [Sulfuritalea sp.]|jgi:PAS domain S-box-containing protein/putative nucleotidyltransferase with HDIG domain|nr:PAS domain S-box protein [Sulfuritalea sp.]